MPKCNSDYANSIVRWDFQYAHRFMNYHEGEAQYLHGHSGLLEIEIGGKVDERTGFAYPCKEAQKLVKEIANNFHHGTLLQEGDPLIEHLFAGYEKAGIRNGTPQNDGVLPKKLDHRLCGHTRNAECPSQKRFQPAKTFAMTKGRF